MPSTGPFPPMPSRPWPGASWAILVKNSPASAFARAARKLEKSAGEPDQATGRVKRDAAQEWLAPHADTLTERWRACVLCGHRVGWLAIVEVAGLAWGGGLCPRCY